MGSPVSVVVAEIVMQYKEERALSTYQRTLPFLFRYVDDTIPALQQDDIESFHNHINEQKTMTYNLPKRSKRMEQFLF